MRAGSLCKDSRIEGHIPKDPVHSHCKEGTCMTATKIVISLSDQRIIGALPLVIMGTCVIYAYQGNCWPGSSLPCGYSHHNERQFADSSPMSLLVETRDQIQPSLGVPHLCPY